MTDLDNLELEQECRDLIYLGKQCGGNEEEAMARVKALTEEERGQLKRIITNAKQPGYVEKAISQMTPLAKSLKVETEKAKAEPPTDEQKSMRIMALLEAHKEEITNCPLALALNSASEMMKAYTCYLTTTESRLRDLCKEGGIDQSTADRYAVVVKKAQKEVEDRKKKAKENGGEYAPAIQEIEKEALELAAASDN